jgi:hypothetical protein
MYSSKFPQKRHPERSASHIYCVTQRLWRGVEGPQRRLSYPCCTGLFDLRSPRTGSAVVRTRWSRVLHRSHLPSAGHRTQRDPARSWFSSPRKTVADPSGAGFGGRKAPCSMGKISVAGVLRLRATSAVSRNKYVMRSAQDDAFVASWRAKKRRLLRLLTQTL